MTTTHAFNGPVAQPDERPISNREDAGSSPAGFAKNDPLDHSKVKVVGGVIHYRIYQQDGSMQAMTAPDTQHNRQVVSWIQSHDRY